MASIRLLGCAAIALAGLPSPAISGELEEMRSFDIVVSGAVREQCALGSVADIDFGNLERPNLGVETQVPFYCNIPFTMTVNGARGALTHTSMPGGQGPYAGRVDYSVGVVLPVRHPNQRTLSKRFTSRQMQAGSVIASNGGIATDGMTLSIELAPSRGEAGLLAGSYAETITITVAPL